AIVACEAAVRQQPDEARFYYQLGRAYDKAGRYQEARTNYKEGADRGYGPAHFNLGSMYWEQRYRKDVEHNIREAVTHFVDAWEKGVDFAAKELAVIYWDGEGSDFPSDHQKSLSWLKRGANTRDYYSHRRLAEHYEKGEIDDSGEVAEQD